MSNPKQRLDKSTKRELIIVIAAVFLVGIYLAWDIIFGGPLSKFFRNREEIVALVRSAGILAPLSFIVLQVVQIILAPIPGQVTGLIGGFIFGWWGILWSVIGSTLGYLIIFLIAKKFGRPLAEKIIKKETLEKFNFLSSKSAAFVIFLIFLIPGLPDDLVGYIAGMSGISIRKLIAMVFVAHIPNIVVTNYIGMGFGSDNLLPIIILSIVVVVLFIIAIYNRERLIKIFKNIIH